MTKQLLFSISPSEVEWFLRQLAAAEAGDGAAACRLGDCYRAGKPLPASPRKAFRWYLRGAWAGDADAMNNLGACYHNGHGCETDVTQAVHWYRRAAEAGSVEALKNLGCCYLHGNGVPEDHERAAGFLREALAKGHPTAAEILSGMGREIVLSRALTCKGMTDDARGAGRLGQHQPRPPARDSDPAGPADPQRDVPDER